MQTYLNKKVWSKHTSIVSTEPSSPAISDSFSHDTPSSEMSISLTSTEEGFNIIPAAGEELAKYFPQLDDDLNSVSIYAPMNTDTLAVDFLDGASGGGATDGSNCLTPISVGMDISMVANKGSMTLSVDELDDDDEMTLSAATTPSLPMDEYKLETCLCCPSHAELPPVATTCRDEVNKERAAQEEVTHDFTDVCDGRDAPILSLPTPTKPQEHSAETFAPIGQDSVQRSQVRKSTDPIAPRIQKQISLFEGDKELFFTISSSSINMPNQSLQSLDIRLRKFENITQSTSNSNFPFESNTLKKSNMPQSKPNEMDFTKSCIDLKTCSNTCSASISATSSASGSPQHKVATTTATGVMVLPTTASVVTNRTKLTTATTTSIGAESGSTQIVDAPSDQHKASLKCGTSTPLVPPHPGALIVKTKFIEPPRRITRSFHGKTQSMDAEILLNDYLAVPRHHSSSSANTSPSTSPSPSPRPAGTRFVATKVVDDLQGV